MLLLPLRHFVFVMRMEALTKRWIRDNRAVTAIEYAMIAGVIVFAIIAGLTKIGTELTPTFNAVSSEL